MCNNNNNANQTNAVYMQVSQLHAHHSTQSNGATSHCPVPAEYDGGYSVTSGSGRVLKIEIQYIPTSYDYLNVKHTY